MYVSVYLNLHDDGENERRDVRLLVFEWAYVAITRNEREERRCVSRFLNTSFPVFRRMRISGERGKKSGGSLHMYSREKN